MKGVIRMFLKLFLSAITIAIIFLILNKIMPDIKFKIQIHKIKKYRNKRRKEFKNKMKELEID